MKAIGGFFTSVGEFVMHEIRSEINPNYTPKEKKKKTIPQKTMTIQEIFIEAIKTDNADKVASLINRVNVNAKDATGLRPIQHAVMGGDRNLIKIVELLLDNGARIDTDLFTLAIKKQYDTRIIAILFERGIPLDFKNSKQQGWMHLAAKRGSIPMIDVLLQHGLSCSDRSATGATPLHLAAKKGGASACEILLKNNVDVNPRDNIGLTPLQYAFKEKNKKKGESIGKYAAFKLIKNGANVNVSDENGCTPLFIAASQGEKQLVEELIARGASLDTPNNMRETPLHIAVKNGQKLIALLLIKHGAPFSEEIQWLAKRKGWNLLEDINTNIETLNDNLVIEEVNDAFVKAQNLINPNEGDLKMLATGRREFYQSTLEKIDQHGKQCTAPDKTVINQISKEMGYFLEDGSVALPEHLLADKNVKFIYLDDLKEEDRDQIDELIKTNRLPSYVPVRKAVPMTEEGQEKIQGLVADYLEAKLKHDFLKNRVDELGREHQQIAENRQRIKKPQEN